MIIVTSCNAQNIVTEKRLTAQRMKIMYTGCPKKSGTLDFRFVDIRKYSIFYFIRFLKTLSSANDQ